jgi:hypothetical protein
MLPSTPRPNLFWELNNGQNIDIKVPFSVRLTEHPVETPVYTSAARALGNSLSSIVASGEIGIVDSNDIFLFVHSNVACFVHIISREPFGVRFQMRGLEYYRETSCHRHELGALNSNAEEYEVFGNFWVRIGYEGSNWQVRALNVVFELYDVSVIAIDLSFLGDHFDDWALLAFCFGLRNADLEGIEESSENIDEIRGVCKRFRNETDLGKINALWWIVRRRLLYSSRRSFIANIGEVFNKRMEQYPEVLRPAIEAMVLILALQSMDLAPNIQDTGEVDKWLDELKDGYLCAALGSAEFEAAFKEGKKCLCSVALKENVSSLLFFRLDPCSWNVFSIQRESLRSVWASEANSQLFLGEDESERFSVQNELRSLHNLIVQSCNLPIGYPAFVSPILSSYNVPLNFNV